MDRNKNIIESEYINTLRPPSDALVAVGRNFRIKESREGVDGRMIVGLATLDEHVHVEVYDLKQNPTHSRSLLRANTNEESICDIYIKFCGWHL